MIYKIISSIIFTVFAALMFFFSISNKQDIQVYFLGSDIYFETPLYLIILLISFISFVIGSLFSELIVAKLSIKIFRLKKRLKKLEESGESNKDLEKSPKSPIKSSKTKKTKKK